MSKCRVSSASLPVPKGFMTAAMTCITYHPCQINNLRFERRCHLPKGVVFEVDLPILSCYVCLGLPLMRAAGHTRDHLTVLVSINDDTILGELLLYQNHLLSALQQCKPMTTIRAPFHRTFANYKFASWLLLEVRTTELSSQWRVPPEAVE